MKLVYDKSLDANQKLAKQAEYFDEANLLQEFDFKNAIDKKVPPKRVNILIPFDMYLDAFEVGKLTGSGYQNTLKIAIALGMKQLKKSIHVS